MITAGFTGLTIKGDTMSYEIELKSADIAALVNSDESLKSAVIALYLKDNLPTLSITDLAADSNADTDSIKLSANALSVALGTPGKIDVALTGKSELSVKSNDERIATASYADGKLTVNGVAAGDTAITLTQGNAEAELKVTIR